MADKDTPPEVLELSDATLTLWRGCKFVAGTQQIATGDHMLVKNKMTGHEDDVVIVKGPTGSPITKRVVHHIEFPSGRGSYSFADVEEAEDKRLLAIHKMFEKKPSK